MHEPPRRPPFEDPVADPAIEDYGAIGDCRSLALVSRFGSIDWWCTPDFSSPSCFAGLLDRERGGRFALTPRHIETAGQSYLARTNVLCTRFNCRDGVLELVDFMTVPETRGLSGDSPQEIVRIARCVEGTVELQVAFQPRPDYARRAPLLTPDGDGRWRCTAEGFSAGLVTSLVLDPASDGDLLGLTVMRRGDQHAALVHTGMVRSSASSLLSDAQERLAGTSAWWREWCARSTYHGDYGEIVMRSALALKLLSHRPTGAVVAAGTTSLRVSENGDRNWDYRYCWFRDTSLVLHAFTDLGYGTESDAFLRWLLHATRDTQPRLQVLYGVHGEARLDERILPHLRGYHGIGPVRIGNAASRQVQHDVYGEVILTACDDVHAGGILDPHELGLVAGFTRVVCDIWREPDHGIWEIRLPPRHNTHSKLMCWVALDRALKLHRDHGLPIDVRQVEQERAAIREDIEANGYNDAMESYVGYYGGDAPDASVLLMPRLGYIDANEPRMRSTVDRVMQVLSAGGLLYRYPPGGAYDGVPGPENLFVICSFWCVDCLARQGRLNEARSMYERLLGLRNNLGLYAEEVRTNDGRPVGNFPQAFSHVGLITAALSLQRAQNARIARS